MLKEGSQREEIRDSPIGNRQFSMPLLSRFLTHARLSRVAKHLSGKVLDAGCGYGELLDYLPEQVHTIILLDRSPQRLSRLETRLSRVGVEARFVLGDIAAGELAL